VNTVVNETYGEVFRTIKWILNEENDVEELWNFSTSFQRTIHKRWDELHIVINYRGEAIDIYGKNVPELWKKTLLWIEEQNLPLHKHIEEGFILGGGDNGKRYAFALQPIHKSRKKFSSIHKYESIITGETYFLETKINTEMGMLTIAKLLKNLGLAVETPLLENGGTVLV
jgi:hypothetical protein